MSSETAGVATDPRKWVRITEDLRGKLTAGVIVAGDTVSIGHLSREWRASRQTIAKSLQTLEAEGMIRRYPGLGYYVLSHRESSAGQVR
jgi:DNA-binding GntR family transcriptional regulator